MLEMRDLPFTFASAMRSFTFEPSFVVEETKKRVVEMTKAREGYDAQIKDVLGKHNIKPDEKTFARLDKLPPYGQITPELRSVIRWRTRSRSLGALIANLEGFITYATHPQVKGIGTIGRVEATGVALNLDECRSMLETFDIAKFESMFREHDYDEPAMGVATAAIGLRYPESLHAALQEPVEPPPLGISDALSGG